MAGERLLDLGGGLRFNLDALAAYRIPRCQGTTKAGKPCRALSHRVGVRGYCPWHTPENVIARERRRKELASGRVQDRPHEAKRAAGVRGQARTVRGCFQGPKAVTLQRAAALCRERTLTDAQRAAALGVSRRTLLRWRRRGLVVVEP